MTQQMWKSITVVIVDPFRDEQAAIAKATALAARSGATLTLLNTFMIPQPAPAQNSGSQRQIIKWAITERLKRLHQLARAPAKRGIKVTCVVEWDYPIHEAVIRHVVKHGADLVVAEAHRHGKLARWILANTDWELIRACPCPIWFARSATLAAAPQLLVAVDPFHAHDKPARLDDRLLKVAQGVVQTLNGTIALAHAYVRPDPPGSLRSKAVSAGPDQSLIDIRERIANLATRHGVDIGQTFVREGVPADVLGSLVRKRRVDVVVMGAVSRSFLVRPLIGNTAERVIDHVECDVLIVKPAGFKTPPSRARPKM